MSELWDILFFTPFFTCLISQLFDTGNFWVKTDSVHCKDLRTKKEGECDAKKNQLSKILTPLSPLTLKELNTYAEILLIYGLNSGKFLRHGAHYYIWDLLPIKISSKSNEGNLNYWILKYFLLNKSWCFSNLSLVPPLSAYWHLIHPNLCFMEKVLP